MIPDRAIARLRGSLIANAIGAVLLTAVMFAIAWVAAFLFDHRRALLYAIIAVAVLMLIGLITHLRGWRKEGEAFGSQWDADSVGTYVSQREVLKVTGPAYVINEIVMAASACVVSVLRNASLIRQLKAHEPQAYDAIVGPLRKNAVTGNRFVPVVSRAKDLDFDLLKPLLQSDIVWVKSEKGVAMIGLNREYDQA